MFVLTNQQKYVKMYFIHEDKNKNKQMRSRRVNSLLLGSKTSTIAALRHTAWPLDGFSDG